MKTDTTDKATTLPELKAWIQGDNYHLYDTSNPHCMVCSVYKPEHVQPILTACNEHTALCAVAEAANNVGMYSRTNVATELHKSLQDLQDAMDILAAVRNPSL